MIVKRKNGKTMNSVMKWMPYKIGVIDQKITDSCSLGKNKMDGWMDGTRDNDGLVPSCVLKQESETDTSALQIE